MDNFDIRKFITEKRLYEQEDVISPDDEGLDDKKEKEIETGNDPLDYDIINKKKPKVEKALIEKIKEIKTFSDDEYFNKKLYFKEIKDFKNDHYYLVLIQEGGENIESIVEEILGEVSQNYVINNFVKIKNASGERAQKAIQSLGDNYDLGSGTNFKKGLPGLVKFFKSNKLTTEKRLYEQEDVIDPDDEALDTKKDAEQSVEDNDLDYDIIEKNKPEVEKQLLDRVKLIKTMPDTEYFNKSLYLNELKKFRKDPYYLVLIQESGKNSKIIDMIINEVSRNYIKENFIKNNPNMKKAQMASKHLDKEFNLGLGPSFIKIGIPALYKHYNK
jgi:hypothetical protein